jgi:hypothetical protein
VVASLDNPSYLAEPISATLVVAAGAPSDRRPPQTKIKKAPPAKTSSDEAKLKFKSSERGSTFECKLDKSKWESCRSPAKYKDLDPGRHKFRVRAIDVAGNVDPSPAKARWEIEP